MKLDSIDQEVLNCSTIWSVEDSNLSCFTITILFVRVSLGNQLDGVNLVEADVVQRFTKKYPDGIVPKPSKSVKKNIS